MPQQLPRVTSTQQQNNSHSLPELLHRTYREISLALFRSTHP
jgi:hypothetical protein